MDDHGLLQEYRVNRSETAFAELVERHIKLVYGTAFRVVGEAQWAQDVAQSVFVELAKKAETVRDGNALAGWLYRTTRCRAANLVRSESRRRQREKEAMSRARIAANDSINAIDPLLDEAIEQLNEGEQNVIALRFLEGRSLREVGEALAVSEDAAQKRVSRVVEKLRAFLVGRGVVVSSAVLCSAISAQAVPSVPVGLAASISHASLAGVVGAGSSGTIAIVESVVMTKAKTTLISAVAAAAVVATLVQTGKVATLQRQIGVLQSQQAEDRRSQARLSPMRAPAKLAATEIEQITSSRSLSELDTLVRTMARRSNWRRFQDWREFILTLAPGDIAKALAAVENLNDDEAQTVFRWDLLEHWARSEPMAALEYAQTISGDSHREHATVKVLKVFGMNDPARARDWVRGLPAGGLRALALRTIITCSGGADPAAAFELVQSLGPAAWQGVWPENLFSAWAGADLSTALARAAEVPLADKRLDSYGSVIKTWAGDDPTAALKWVAAMPVGNPREQLFEVAIKAWAQSDPQSAIAYAFDLPSSHLPKNEAKAMLERWATVAPEAVLAWSENLKDPADQQGARRAALLALAKNKPADAIAAAPALSETARSEVIQAAACGWTRLDPEGAASQLERFVEGADRDAFMTGLADALTTISPSAAAGVAAELPSGDIQDSTVRTIVRRWTASDPAATAAWVTEFPEGGLRVNMLFDLAKSWTGSDPAAASKWLTSLPADQSSDGAYSGYVKEMTERAPELAAPWAAQIRRPEIRNRMMGDTAFAWLQKDRAAAMAWMNESDMPAKLKQRILAASSPAHERPPRAGTVTPPTKTR